MADNTDDVTDPRIWYSTSTYSRLPSDNLPTSAVEHHVISTSQTRDASRSHNRLRNSVPRDRPQYLRHGFYDYKKFSRKSEGFVHQNENSDWNINDLYPVTAAKKVDFQALDFRSGTDNDFYNTSAFVGDISRIANTNDKHVDDFLKWVDDLPLVTLDGREKLGVDVLKRRKEKSVILDYDCMKTETVSDTSSGIKRGVEQSKNIQISVKDGDLINTEVGDDLKWTNLAPRFKLSDECTIDRSKYIYSLKSKHHLKTNWEFDGDKADKSGMNLGANSAKNENPENRAVCIVAALKMDAGIGGFDNHTNKKDNCSLEINAKSVNYIQKYSFDNLRHDLVRHKSSLPFSKIYSDHAVGDSASRLRHRNDDAPGFPGRSPSVLTLTINQSSRPTRKPAHIERSIKSIETGISKKHGDSVYNDKRCRYSSKSATEPLTRNLSTHPIEPTFKMISVFPDSRKSERSRAEPSQWDSDANIVFTSHKNFYPPKVYRVSERNIARPRELEGFVLCPTDSIFATPL